MDGTTCPQADCGLPADVLERYVLDSTSGPVEHAITHCPAGHRYNLPLDMLPGASRSHIDEQLPPDPFEDLTL